MDLQNEEPQLMQGEEQEPYVLEKMPVYISIEDSTVSLLATVMEVTSDGFTFQQQKEEGHSFTVYTAFSNTTSIGINGDNLLVFVGDQQPEEEQEGVPEIIKLISAAPNGGNVQLTGYCFSISIDFKHLGKNVLKEVHDIFVNYMGDADEHASRYDEDQEFEQMISADDIDQNGNIIQKNNEEEDSEEEEEEEKPTNSDKA